MVGSTHRFLSEKRRRRASIQVGQFFISLRRSSSSYRAFRQSTLDRFISLMAGNSKIAFVPDYFSLAHLNGPGPSKRFGILDRGRVVTVFVSNAL